MLRLALLLVVIVPALAWAVVKPVRVIVPEWTGVSCVSPTLCLDDVARRAEAEALYAGAIAFEGYRSAFSDWYRAVGREKLWAEGGRL
ncbi:hypothetical protein HHL11_10490 [Ramlibacter sp. G-1-2-2]|uniref:Uncharacterized protein n=1 Tax=Ramlibacter agri TaxID=2728837 RepID=A0A848H3T8_9BURK|nr:hypothetical protein [Ramlibacter agri]